MTRLTTLSQICCKIQLKQCLGFHDDKEMCKITNQLTRRKSTPKHFFVMPETRDVESHYCDILERIRVDTETCSPLVLP